ncbi:MAG: DUF177 domain-containing protein [Betaproteobacteria bacterium]|nr:DUF177 domain-containing protein [Betaproteobacteria bacterium]
MFARHFIDSLDFARNGRELRGEIPVSEMPRLQDMLAAPEGDIGYVVRGFQDKDVKPKLEVALDGMCQLRCQRCLNALAYPVKLVSRLLLVQGDELDESSIEEDELDSIQADKHMDVLALVEEEILLSLPFAPKHPPGACQPVAGGLDWPEPERKPFAALAGLKIK